MAPAAAESSDDGRPGDGDTQAAARALDAAE